MLFNSIDFLIFLPLVFAIYWLLNKNLSLQNFLLLASSYFFYACWDYRFLFLLIFSTFLDYFTGLKMADASSPSRKKVWFWTSIVVNLGFLMIFKYFNFFADSFAAALSNVGVKINPLTLNVILPVGISFYTFHGLSYVIDIYKNRIKPVKNLMEYSVFVSFFPLLVAGPIERATHLLPQIQKKRTFTYAQGVEGLKQILWGMFKKVVIADNCAEYANTLFNHTADYSGSALALGAVFFAIQIYCDFSGYSDIALGTARLFGIELLRNFSFPYFSRDIAEFWRRWHISLSSWFKDYVYIPLGGSKTNLLLKVRNVFIIFLLSGFWHGANWTFIFWGGLNALYFLPLFLLKRNRDNLEVVAEGRIFPTPREFGAVLITFCLTVFAWIFFRAESLHHAFLYISKMFTRLWSVPQVSPNNTLVMIILLFFAIEWLGRSRQYAIAFFGQRWPWPLRWAFYYCIAFAILFFAGKEQQFIYFQF